MTYTPMRSPAPAHPPSSAYGPARSVMSHTLTRQSSASTAEVAALAAAAAAKAAAAPVPEAAQKFKRRRIGAATVADVERVQLNIDVNGHSDAQFHTPPPAQYARVHSGGRMITPVTHDHSAYRDPHMQRTHRSQQTSHETPPKPARREHAQFHPKSQPQTVHQPFSRSLHAHHPHPQSTHPPRQPQQPRIQPLHIPSQQQRHLQHLSQAPRYQQLPLHQISPHQTTPQQFSPQQFSPLQISPQQVSPQQLPHQTLSANRQKAPRRGLKTFAISIAAKLQKYGTTSYAAVADELVRDTFIRLRASAISFDTADEEKNIRRRVYDALNVLSSMGFVDRCKKDVQWRGVAGFMSRTGLRPGDTLMSGPHIAVEGASATSVNSLKRDMQNVRERLKEKRARIAELRSQRECLQRIVSRNISRDGARLTTGSDVLVGDDLEFVRPDSNRVDLPFVMVSADAATTLSLEMEDHREKMVFNFDAPFQIHDGYSIVGQVCQQEPKAEGVPIVKEEDVVEQVAPANLNGVMWRKLYDGHETSPVTNRTAVTPVAGGSGSASTAQVPPELALRHSTFAGDTRRGLDLG